MFVPNVEISHNMRLAQMHWSCMIRRAHVIILTAVRCKIQQTGTEGNLEWQSNGIGLCLSSVDTVG